MDILITGIMLGGTYALLALGLTLQYGVARIMNLATGEMLVLGCFAAMWLHTGGLLNPLVALLVVGPLAFALNWAIYAVILKPLVARAKTRGHLETDSILVTFGILFLAQGIMLMVFGGAYMSYSFLAQPFDIFGRAYGMNRAVAFVMALVMTGLLYLLLYRTRQGTAIRAVAVNPVSALLVGINVPRVAALAFALGGALTVCGGVLLSTFYTFNVSMGMAFTMKALIVVIMGGVGDVRGAFLAAMILGLTETAVASLIDPGLTIAATYILFVIVLLFRPQGIFGRATA